MKRYPFGLTVAVLLPLFATAQVPLQINYQGRLLQGTNLFSGSVSFRARIYTNETGSSFLFEDTGTVTIVDGLYQYAIGSHPTYGSLANALRYETVWLEISIQSSPLTPREKIVAVPFAVRSGPSGTGHTILDDSCAIGGGHSNTATGARSTIAGGLLNQATMESATVGGGYSHQADAPYATVSGGGVNAVVGTGYGSVGGGAGNTVGGSHGTVSGGGENTANGNYAVIGGGHNNTADGAFSTIPGGRWNEAPQSYSLAAGYMAHALHSGTFVWSDFQSYKEFESTDTNQFLIRAANGVGVNTNDPGDATLKVAGLIHTTEGGIRFPNGTIQTTAASGEIHFSRNALDAADGDPTNAVYVDDNGHTGIGTILPGTYQLNVQGPSYFADDCTLAVNKTVDGRDLSVDGAVLDTIYGWGDHATAGYLKGSVSAHYVPRSDGGTQLIAGVLYDNGKIGIGTNSPAESLDVAGGILADSFAFHTPQTGYWAIAGDAFHTRGNVSWSAIERDDSGTLWLADYGTFECVAPVHLPNGSEVSGMRLFYYDMIPGTNFSVVLRRYDRQGDHVDMAEVETWWKIGYASGSTTAIVSNPIDNEAYAYALVGLNIVGGGQHKLAGVTLTYVDDTLGP